MTASVWDLLVVMTVDHLYHEDDNYKDNTELDYGTVKV